MELTRKILLLFLPAIFIPHYGLCSEKLSSTSNDTTPTYSAEITRSFPRSREVFTQGLLYMDESLLEGTGLYGQSALRRVNIQTGFIEQQVALADRYFGEGITLSNNMIIQLTWKAGIGFVYDKSSFSLLHTFEYPGEGWGITRNDTHLIMSHGTDTLSFIDPQTYSISHTLKVSDQGNSVHYLNELEYIKGEIFANVWPQDRIVRINPETGKVTGWISLAGILSEKKRDKNVQVFNGIAYDESHDRLFVTIKNWPRMYEIRLIPLKE